MVCVHSSWLLACASQRMCEPGTVWVCQGVCNRPRWGFGKKSIREGEKKVPPCHQGAFGTFSSPSSPYRPPPHHISSCLPLSLGSGEGWGQRTWTLNLTVLPGIFIILGSSAFAKRKSQTGMNCGRGSLWGSAFCLWASGNYMWGLSWEARRLARSPLLRRERGSEKGWSVALGGASGSWRGEEVNEMRTVPGNLPVWRWSEATERPGFQNTPRT